MATTERMEDSVAYRFGRAHELLKMLMDETYASPEMQQLLRKQAQEFLDEEAAR